MTFDLRALLLDAGCMALLMLAGQWLRAHVRWIQALYLPTAVLAGLLGLLLGPQVAGVLPLSEAAAGYAWMLIIVLFASLPFSAPPTRSPREVMQQAGGTFCFNLGAELALFGSALLLGGAALTLFFEETSASLSLLLPAGFVGGHGYAGAIGTVLEGAGEEGAVTIGYTFATIGLLSAIAIGIPLIRVARARGWVGAQGQVSGSMRRGLVEEGQRVSLGEATTCPSSIDPLASHTVLVVATAALGVWASEGIASVSAASGMGELYVPEVATAMVCGVLLKWGLGVAGLGARYVDREVAARVGNTATDWLIAFGLATLRLDVVASYLGPIVLLCVVGWTTCLAYLFLVSPRVHRSHWFERGIFVFGWTTGVVAMGIALLRIVDPEGRSQTLPAYAQAYVLIAPIELALVASLPILALRGHLWTAGSGLLLTSSLLVLAAYRLRAQGDDVREPLIAPST